MNPVAALLARQELNWQTLVAYYITGFPVDCVHAGGDVLLPAGPRRADARKARSLKVKYGIVE